MAQHSTGLPAIYYGLVYELSPTSGGSWNQILIHDFTGGPDGGFPQTGLIFGPGGNLYAVTAVGGGNGAGTVVEYSNSGGAGTSKTIHSFSGKGDGFDPLAPLTADAAGNLYGTTVFGGNTGHDAQGSGVVFELSPLSGGEWRQRVLYAFTGLADGEFPEAGVTLDAAGKLYADRQELQLFVRDDVPAPAGYEAGWNSRYTTELTPEVDFYLRGEEYSAQIWSWIAAIKSGQIACENDFMSAAETDRNLELFIESATEKNNAPTVAYIPELRREGKLLKLIGRS